jgi:hypothetical protein
LMSAAETIAKALNGRLAVGGRGYICPCPVPSHGRRRGDRNPSLLVRDGDFQPLVHCFAGCDRQRVLEELRRRGLIPDFARSPRPTRYDGSALSPSAARRIVATYNYDEENGDLLFQVVRYEPKDFRQRRPDGAGGWSWSVHGVRQVPYRLPELIETLANRRVVLVVEGEKDVEALRAVGITATCSPGGASKWRDEYSAHFTGADVIIIPDNDDPGRKHAERVAASLCKVTAHVRLLELPGLPPAGDVSDWLAAGGTREQLDKLIAGAAEWQPQQKPDGQRQQSKGRKSSKLVCLGTIKPAATDWLWQNRIPRGAQTISTGVPGVGKSQQHCDIVAHVSTGALWLDGTPCPCGDTIMLTCEDSYTRTIVPRLLAAGANLQRVYGLECIRIDAKTKRAFLLTEDLDELEQHLARLPNATLVTIDPITGFFGSGKINSNSVTDIRGALGPMADLAERYNVAVHTITHPPKTTTSAMNAFVGSQAFVAASRMAYLTVEEKDEGKSTGRYLLTMVRSSLGPKMPTLAYRLQQITVGQDDRDSRPIIGSYVHWEDGTVEMTADEALAASAGGSDEPTATDDAVDFLGKALADGRLPVKETERQAVEAGLLAEGKPIGHSKPFRAAERRWGSLPPRAECVRDGHGRSRRCPPLPKVPCRFRGHLRERRASSSRADEAGEDSNGQRRD